jgi:hypothetical protein
MSERTGDVAYSADCFGTREEMIDRYLALKAENERLGSAISDGLSERDTAQRKAEDLDVEAQRYADIASKEREYAIELQDAARWLVKQLDECEPHITSAFHMAFTARGGVYSGPQYGKALDVLRAALAKNPAPVASGESTTRDREPETVSPNSAGAGPVFTATLILDADDNIIPGSNIGEPLTVGSDPRDTLRLRWFAETAQLAEDGSDWNDTILGMVVDRFNLWRKSPPNDALDAMRKAIDTQVVHEDAPTTPSSCSSQGRKE